MKGSARGSLMYTDDKSGFWQTRDKMEKLGFVCEKKINDFCIFDMAEFGSYCLDFRLDGRYDLHSWGGARQDCNKYGMTMLQIGGETKDEFINQKLVESGLFSKDGDALGIWIGAQGGKSINSSTKHFLIIFCRDNE